MPPDAVVLLAGEDAIPRLHKAVGRFAELKRWAMMHPKFAARYKPMMVITGGKHDEPRWWGAEKLAPKMMGQGVAFDRILIENEAMNTREQADNIIDLAIDKDWTRLMLVGSPYHMPRAFLTFLKVLLERKLDDDIELLPDITDQVPWFSPPEGMETSRVKLMDEELAKIAEYKDHVATYRQGLAYVEYWESHVPEQGGQG